MSTCRVLRCQNEAAHRLVLNEAPLYESAVCGFHHDMVESGASWESVPGQDVVLMGKYVTARYVSHGLSDGGFSDLGDSFEVSFDLGRNGQVVGGVRLRVTPDQARNIARSISEWTDLAVDEN